MRLFRFHRTPAELEKHRARIARGLAKRREKIAERLANGHGYPIRMGDCYPSTPVTVMLGIPRPKVLALLKAGELTGKLGSKGKNAYIERESVHDYLAKHPILPKEKKEKPPKPHIKTTPLKDGYCSIATAMSILGVSCSKVNKLCDRGELRSVQSAELRYAGKLRYIERASIDEYLKRKKKG